MQFAAVLFIIVMQEMAETMTPLWQQAEIVTPEFRFHKETKSCYGKMKGPKHYDKGNCIQSIPIFLCGHQIVPI
jgi:hypothetical protein